ncbi:hypothetical protein [Marinitenerispora sediminis]|uniref:Uncharacterized protein n=1 Tax=Marinitenerispora sediminis TaxID=1931232 RepID=A0A368T778_9ACTN|nr:hypothetical protein [Marinitenerispora sediminis]RCV50649.1 hypothetical protein DEF28_17505 [Marinitenerispora sediminis]RCV56209.1 hypothetical protein DEF23_13020 [Marinitenerispora sediminis]RCV59440.1 hypothetical protein DEF24_09690 [Marinitenerispora sediminis]
MSPDDQPDENERFVADLRGGTPLLGPAPDSVRAAARAAYAMRRPEALLAAVREDSAHRPPPGLRDAALDPGLRFLTFEAGDWTIRLEITAHDDLRDITGRVSPAGCPDVEIRHPRGRHREPVDRTGAFVARDIDRGPLSLLLRPPGGRPVTTDWIAI